MNKWVLFLLFFTRCISVEAQTTKIVQVTKAGTLSSLISDAEASTLLSLTVTGVIDSRDIAYVRDRLRILTVLDLSGTVINTYTGTDGTNTGTNSLYPANELPMYAFYNPFRQTYMSSLTSLKFPSSLVSIGYLACYFCWNLTGQLSIPATVKNITDNAFYGCYSLTAFSVSGSNTRYSGSNGVLFSKNQDTLLIFPNAKAISYTIPSTVKHIYSSAFENAYALTGLVLSSSIQSVGAYGFCNCAGIIGNLTLPESMIRLDDGAFRGCYNLTGTITLPASLNDLGSYCFFECNNIQSFSVSASNANYASSNDVLFSKKLDTLFICPAKKTGTYILPSTVRLIGSHAFYKCALLTDNIQIPKLTDYIGYYAFYGCKTLASFSVESGNPYFTTENGALYSLNKDRLLVCPSLKSGTFVLPEGLRFLDPSSFSYCAQLTGFMNIPASVEYLGDYAFYGCTALSGFTVAPANNYYAAQDGLLYDKTMDTLYACPLSKTGSLTIPTGVRSLGHASLDGCVGLTTVVLPSTLNHIGDYAFEYCSGLQSIQIPSSVEKFGKGVFFNCTNLKEFAIGKNQPPIIDYYFLEGIVKSNCTLVVPLQASTTYRKAPYWESFSQVTEKTFAAIPTVNRTKSFLLYQQNNEWVADGLIPGNTLEIVRLDGSIVFHKKITGEVMNLPLPGDGLYLIRSGNQSEKIVQRPFR